MNDDVSILSSTTRMPDIVAVHICNLLVSIRCRVTRYQVSQLDLKDQEVFHNFFHNFHLSFVCRSMLPLFRLQEIPDTDNEETTTAESAPISNVFPSDCLLVIDVSQNEFSAFLNSKRDE